MNFKSASEIESVVWQMKLADYPRSLNRSRINDLFNGVPPYTAEEVQTNNIETNVNFLEGLKLSHDARRQLANAFLKSGAFFTIRGDAGPKHKVDAWSRIVTKEINRLMKRSRIFFETYRSTFANVILHGVGPSAWNDRHHWEPDALGMDDVLIPGATLLTMKNLPFFAVYRQYTAYQLRRMTSGPNVDKGWQMPVVNEVLKWVDEKASQLMGTNWPEIWSPEKQGERIKEDGGLYAADTVPTINAWDFFFWDDTVEECGWKRRIILDAQITPGANAVPAENYIGGKNQYLYNSGDRIFSSKREGIIHFQFGDLSAVAPFRYHTVRGLGFLLYAVCHLQNRMRCKFNDAVFEAMLQYFRVHSTEDAERAQKINLIDKGIIDDSVEFVKQQDRWKVDQALVESGLGHNREIMGSNSSSYVQDYGFGSEEQQKTATQIMAEQNSATALVGAALLQAYSYEEFRYIEICRRFCEANSPDPDVRKFRVRALSQGVAEKFLNPDSWDVMAERVMGSGNKMLEMTIAKELMAARTLYDPEPQRSILRDFTLAVTDDPGRTERLVPEKPVRVTDSFHDAQLAMGVLMQGLPVALKTGMNHIEYVEAILESMGQVIQGIEQRGSMATVEQFMGLNNAANHVAQHIALIAQDPAEKQRVKQYGDALGRMMNMVKAYGQRIQQAQQKAAQAGMGGNSGPDPKEVAKARTTEMQAQQKIEANAESHAQRTAQKAVQAEMEEKRKQQQHEAEMVRQGQKTNAEIQQQAAQARLDLETQAAQNRLDIQTQKEQASIDLEAQKKAQSEQE